MFLPEIVFKILCDNCKNSVIEIEVENITDLYCSDIIKQVLKTEGWISKGKIHLCYDCYTKNKNQLQLNLIHSTDCLCGECKRKKLKKM